MQRQPNKIEAVGALLSALGSLLIWTVFAVIAVAFVIAWIGS